MKLRSGLGTCYEVKENLNRKINRKTERTKMVVESLKKRNGIKQRVEWNDNGVLNCRDEN